MARAKELPEQVSEFVDMAKTYVRQETIEPAKRLGRVAGMSFAAAFLFLLATLLLAVVGLRVLLEVLPDGPIWSGVGYVIAAIVYLVIAGIIMWRAAK